MNPLSVDTVHVLQQSYYFIQIILIIFAIMYGITSFFQFMNADDEIARQSGIRGILITILAISLTSCVNIVLMFDDDKNSNVVQTQSSIILKSEFKNNVADPVVVKNDKVAKDINYKLFFMCFIGGILLGICFIIVKHILVIVRFRKYRKYVNQYISLPNDFMILSTKIDDIDQCLENIKNLSNSSSKKMQASFDSLYDLLNEKKILFFSMVLSLKEDQKAIKLNGDC